MACTASLPLRSATREHHRQRMALSMMMPTSRVTVSHPKSRGGGSLSQYFTSFIEDVLITS